VGGDDGFRLRDPSSGRLVREFGEQGGIMGQGDFAYASSMALVGDGSPLVATGDSRNNEIRIWDGETGGLVATVPDAAGALAWTTLASGQPMLAVSGSSSVFVCDPFAPAERFILARDTAWKMCIACGTGLNGQPVIAACSRELITTWDLGHRAVTSTSTVPRPADSTECLAWGKTGEGAPLLGIGGSDGTVTIWDTNRDRELCETFGFHQGSVYDLGWGTTQDGRMLLASGGGDSTVRIWEPFSRAELAVIAHQDEVNTVAFAPAGTVLAQDPGGHAGTETLYLATGSDDGYVRIYAVQVPVASAAWSADPRVRKPGRVAEPVRGAVEPIGTQGAARTARSPESVSPGIGEVVTLVAGVVAMGERSVWAGLGLVGDLVELLSPDVARPSDDRLNDPALAALVSDPALASLRGLGWRSVRARSGVAGLIVSGLAPAPRFAPPPGTALGERATALVRALNAGAPYRSGGAGLGELRQALGNLPPGVAILLEVVGEDVVSADPGLPVQLLAPAESLPVLRADIISMVSRSVHQLDRADPSHPDQPGGARLELSQDPIDHDLVPVLTRRGRPDRIIPTHLAMPPRVRGPLQAASMLLYRHHADPPAVLPRPATVLLDVSPAVFGPVELVLRLIAHLLTVTAWRAGGKVWLVTTARPRVVMPLERRGDLVAVWTTRSLDPPDLHAAARTAAGLGQPVVALTHHATALDQGLRSGTGLTIVTTHTPGAPVSGTPGRAGQTGQFGWSTVGYRCVPPRPTPDELAALVDALLDDLSGPGQGA
jgi:WD40 repeat protein